MSTTQFVAMYHPLISSTITTPVRVALQSVDDHAAHGWLLVDPDATLPDPVTPYYTKEASDSRFLTPTAARAALVPKWKPNTAYVSGEPVVNPSGQLVTANATFTSGASYVAGNWTITAGGGGGGSTTDASLLTTGTLDPARIADSSLPVAKLTGTLLDSQIPSGIARDTEVSTAVAALVNSSPTTLDTLNELAAALGNDPNFATSTATAIGNKADTSALTRAAAPVDYTGTFRGAWAGSTAYVIGDVVTTEAGLFRCRNAHTSNNAGFRYNRSDWEAVPVPVLAGGTAIPVRQLDLTNAGAGFVGSPKAGLFQRRPKQFNYRGEQVVWQFTAAADFTASGATGGVAAGASVGGSVVLTSAAASTSPGNFQAAVLATPVNLTGQHLRVPIKVSASSGRTLTLQLTSAGTDYTNRLALAVMAGNVDGTRTGLWTMVSLPTSEFAVTGTGADLTAINGMRLVTENGTGGQFTVEVSRVTMHPNSADKAKVIFWLDDGTWTSHLAAIKTAAKYGFPVTLAPIADNLANAGAAITADSARYVQDFLGGQVAVHAFGPQDHNNVQDGTLAFEQLLDYQHFGLAMGLHGVEDMAYWSSGFAGNATADRDVAVRKLFRSARGGTSRVVETLPPGQPNNTRAMMTGGADTSTGTWQPYVTRAIACKGLAQFVWHDMAAGALTEFATFCAWLDTQRATVQVVTPQGAYDPLCV